MPKALRSVLATILTLFAAFACARPNLVVTDAWIRATAPGAQVAALYLELRNDSLQSETLVAVETPAARRASLHETHTHDGVSGMRPRERIVIESGSTLRMAPGGLHVMLEGLERDLRVGERIPVTLRFASGRTVAVIATVQPLGSQ